MPVEPTSAAGVTAVAAIAGSAIPAGIIVIFGVSLGLRVDIMVAGFSGALCAMAFMPATEELASNATGVLHFALSGARRLFKSLGSALLAGYTAHPASLFLGAPFPATASDFINGPGTLGVACLIGAGAQTLLPLAIERMGRFVGGVNANTPPGGKP